MIARALATPFASHRMQRKRSFGSVTAYETSHQGGDIIPMHAHPTMTLTFVMAGGFRETYGVLRCREVEVAGVLLRAPEIPHRNAVSAWGLRTLGLSFDQPVDEETGARLRIRPHTVLPLGALYGVAARVLHELRQPDDLSALVVESALQEALVYLARRDRTSGSARPPRWLVCAREYLDSRITERGLALSVAAAQIGVAPAVLARTFRRYIGCSVGEYIRQRRLAEALRLLSERGRPIASAAVAAGFVDQSHFTHVCRRFVGRTPGDLLRSLRTAP